MVLRQPFGGMGKSALGAGIKVGFFNYVAQFMEFKEVVPPPVGAIRSDHPLLQMTAEWKRKLDWGQLDPHKENVYMTIRAIKSCLYWYEHEFSKEKDYFHLRGQDNVVRYLPIGTVMVRLHADDTLFETLTRIAAARISRCRSIISIPVELYNGVTAFLETKEGKQIVGKAVVLRQTDEDVIGMLPKIQRIRYAAPDRVPISLYREASRSGFYIARSRVLMEGRIELLQYFREQSVCYDYHRYGNLGERAPGEET
jgi:RHH-type proline utilization regulon transcriptional repressor/proline dehydrogenase/delta 1-pyrroline-5-carboxylate dehydrogenase